MTESVEVVPCRICGKAPSIEHGQDHWPWCSEYWCHIQCQEHDYNGVAGTSLDNAIEAQREAEAAWNRLQKQEGETA